MKVGLVGFPGCGKSTVFGALTGLPVETGYGRGKATNLGVVKVPDSRVKALAEIFSPKKTTYAEISFIDLGGAGGDGIDRALLDAMREVDALCHVVRGYPGPAGDAPDPLREISALDEESILADLEIVERRLERLARDRSNPRELELLERIQATLEGGSALRGFDLSDEERRMIAGYRFLSQKPLLLVLNVDESDVDAPVPDAVQAAANERGLGLVALSAQVEMEIAQMDEGEQQEFLESLGINEPARDRFIAAAYTLCDLVSMLTAGPDECRAWPIPRGTPASRAAGKIHSDLERGFIRAAVVPWQDLVELGSEARCRESGKLRVEGKDYVVKDGDVVNIRFNV